VDHAFPRPSVALYHGQDRDRVRLKGVKGAVDRYPDGVASATLFWTIPQNLFECEMALQFTNHILSKFYIYRCSENNDPEQYQLSLYFSKIL
jgi:hypothetical protein